MHEEIDDDVDDDVDDDEDDDIAKSFIQLYERSTSIVQSF